MATAIRFGKEVRSKGQHTITFEFKNVHTSATTDEVQVGPLRFTLQLHRTSERISVMFNPIKPDVVDALRFAVSARLATGIYATSPKDLNYTDVPSDSIVPLFVLYQSEWNGYLILNSLVLRITITIPTTSPTVLPNCLVDPEGIEYDRAGEHSHGSALVCAVNTNSTSACVTNSHVTIIAGDSGHNREENTSSKFTIHALTLAARSPVFRTMLTSPMQEATTHEIHITDFSPEAVAAFVRFLHTDRCSHADLQAHTPQLLQLADKYQVPALGAVCAQYVCGALSCENAMGVLKLADRCNAREVRQEALRFIAQHVDDMCHSANVFGDVELGGELLKDLLIAVHTK